MPKVSTPPPVVIDDLDLDDIKSLDSFVKAHPDIVTEPRIRWLIFNRKSNGLESSGAVIKRAGRWYVVVPRLKAWLLGGSALAA